MCYFSIDWNNSVSAQNPIVQSILNDVKLDSLIHFVKQLTGESPISLNGVTDTIKSRYAFHPDNELAFQYMKQVLSGYGLQIDSFVFGSTGKNLIASKIGYAHPNTYYILGAHYDNLPTSLTAPGADDNASGTAAVLECARVFSNYNFPYTIQFAFWDEEELGLLGSADYVPNIISMDDTLLGYVNLDMLGWDGNNDTVADLNVRPVGNSLQLADKAIWCDSVYNIQLKLHVVNPGHGGTDHTSFWNNGLTAIGIDEEYDNDFNPYWHTIADSLGQFNLNFYERCTKLAFATIADGALSDTTGTNTSIEYEYERFPTKIYPIPTYSTLNIHFPFPLKKEANIVLTNFSGQVLFQKSVIDQTFVISTDAFTDGMYNLTISVNEIITHKKIVVSH